MKTFLQKLKALFTKSEVEKTSLQKTARFAIVFDLIAIVGTIVYFAVVDPLVTIDDPTPPTLYEGEVYESGSIYILRTYDRKEIRSIYIHNELEEYTLNAYTDANGDVQFAIEGHENIPLDAEMVSYFIADVRNLITNAPAGELRIHEEATEEVLKTYGLDKASNPSYFVVTLTDGSSYRLNIGNSLVTTTGYYVSLEGRKNVVNGVEYDIVYALRSSLSTTVLAKSTALLSPELTTYDMNIYNATLFGIEKYTGDTRKPIVLVGLVEDQGISASSAMYEMQYPSSYVINEDNYSNNVLTNLAYVTATEIVAYGEAIHTPEVYEQFALDLDKERLENLQDKNYAMVYYTTADPSDENFASMLNVLYFSPKQTDLEGTEFYYVYSPLKEVIGKVDATTFAFVEWPLAQYTNPYLYFEYFTSCENFEIVSEREKLDHHFEITGKERTRTVEVTTTGGDIVYTVTDTGEQIPIRFVSKYERTDKGQTFTGDFERFRNLYYVLITRTLALYAEVDETVTTKADEPYAVIKVQTAPKDHPISYYQYDEYGQRKVLLRDEGGNILCREVLVPTTLSDGTVTNISYDRAYYDEEAGRFFLKSVDSNDGNQKPSGYTATDIETVKATAFLPKSAYGEYDESVYTYEIYDLYDSYIDYDGNPVSQMNSTYKYVIPTTTINTYRLTSDGQKELIETTVERAEVGVYIRTASIEKLFSDTHKFLNGEPIDTMGVN